jgi:hypothetical protein
MNADAGALHNLARATSLFGNPAITVQPELR